MTISNTNLNYYHKSLTLRALHKNSFESDLLVYVQTVNKNLDSLSLFSPHCLLIRCCFSYRTFALVYFFREL